MLAMFHVIIGIAAVLQGSFSKNFSSCRRSIKQVNDDHADTVNNCLPSSGGNFLPEFAGKEKEAVVGLEKKLDSIAVSVFADIFIELTNTESDGKIQITILILRRGALSRVGWSDPWQDISYLPSMNKIWAVDKTDLGIIMERRIFLRW